MKQVVGNRVKERVEIVYSPELKYSVDDSPFSKKSRRKFEWVIWFLCNKSILFEELMMLIGVLLMVIGG